ncbi:hypothetical protein mvi_65630 (plasmid) [Methylobacterium indicum]|uniref:Uncharacterized protein n=1 Tax=Methylobacterium indicum TaxID=1775910 RepID=A0A8H8X1D9_9HYPH|nr:hypothetical protein mvi_65630 [Methylobacterium indicum]
MNGAVGRHNLSAVDGGQAVQGGEGKGQGAGIVFGRGKLAAEIGSARASQDPGEAAKTAEPRSAFSLVEVRGEGPPGIGRGGHGDTPTPHLAPTSKWEIAATPTPPHTP